MTAVCFENPVRHPIPLFRAFASTSYSSATFYIWLLRVLMVPSNNAWLIFPLYLVARMLQAPRVVAVTLTYLLFR